MLVAFGETAEGASDGTVAITLPAAEGPLTYQVVATVRFGEERYEWIEGPFYGDAESFVEWDIWIPDAARMVDEQYDYLSDLFVMVKILDRDEPVGRASAGYARVAFEPGVEGLVLTRAEAAELAPGDAWGESAEPRVEVVERSAVPRPEAPPHDGRVAHSEEVDG
jgi:hypothetical protein